MNKLFFTISMLFLGFASLNAQAPSYTSFEWDVAGIGFVLPVNEDSIKGGISFGSEVRYNLLDNVSVGLAGEMNLFDLEELEDDEEGTINASFSSFITSDYYFSTTSANRAFAGLGVGINYNGEIEVIKEGESNFIESKTGASLAPRIGYELDHVRFLVQYNLGLSEDLYDYISFRVALTLWGGYRG